MPTSKMKNDALFMIAPTESSWVYGWTHYKMAGQTEARMNRLTQEVEIRDGKRWVRCVSGSHKFFTPSSDSNCSSSEDLKAGPWN